MKEIKIIPIFNQSAPGIWDEFLDLRINAMRTTCNHIMSPDEIASANTEFRRSWARLKHNFAFAAYDGDRMIGCIHGDCQKNSSFIRHLYIAPEYQKQGLGCSLLAYAEQATSLLAIRTDIVALPNAEKFYRHYGYSSPLHTNNYFKDIKGRASCNTVPLFSCPPSLARKISGLSPDFKPEFVNVEHLPAYVHFDNKLNITGFGFMAPGVDTPTICARSASPDDWGRSRVTKAFNNLRTQQDILSAAKTR